MVKKKYFLVSKRFLWWIIFVLAPPPLIWSLVISWWNKYISWSPRDSLGEWKLFLTPPLIYSLVISWWNSNISWPPRDSRGKISLASLWDQLLSLLASFPPPRDHETTEWGGGPYERFNKRISWLPRDSLGGLNFVLDPPPPNLQSRDLVVK